MSICGRIITSVLVPELGEPTNPPGIILYQHFGSALSLLAEIGHLFSYLVYGSRLTNDEEEGGWRQSDHIRMPMLPQMYATVRACMPSEQDGSYELSRCSIVVPIPK